MFTLWQHGNGSAHAWLQCVTFTLIKAQTNVCLCFLLLQNYYQNKLKLAIIGQSLFGQEVYANLRKQGHKVVGVFTVPDKDGKADPLGESTLIPSVFTLQLMGY